MALPSSTSRTLNHAQLKRALLRCVAVKRPAMIWGPPGIGKSDSIAQLCKSMNGKLYDVRLPLLEPTDLRGMPYYNKDIGKMDWAPPIDLPDQETADLFDIIFLFLDEINGAAPAVQSAAYQLILNRQIGKYVLPDNVVVIAAGNRDGDKGVTYRMPSPLANRFVHFELKVDFDSWQEWAIENRMHKDVMGFLNFSKNSLYDFDPASPHKSFATPRSWEFVSQLLSDDTDEATMTDIIAGTVGEGLALKFLAHRQVAGQMPTPASILNGSVKNLEIKQVSAQYSLAISCCYELKDMWDKVGKTPKEDEFHKAADNFLGFIMNQFMTEVTVMSTRMALQNYNLPFSSKKLTNFDEYYKKYGKLIIAASI